MNDQTIKHLEFIQSVINRISTNSFLLKGWTVTVVAALFALAAKDTDSFFALIAVFSSFAFWGLDAYYLRQERLFRKLYDDVRKVPNSNVEVFSLSTSHYRKQVPNWFITLWSPSIITVHGLVVIFVIVFLISR